MSDFKLFCVPNGPRRGTYAVESDGTRHLCTGAKGWHPARGNDALMDVRCLQELPEDEYPLLHSSLDGYLATKTQFYAQWMDGNITWNNDRGMFACWDETQSRTLASFRDIKSCWRYLYQYAAALEKAEALMREQIVPRQKS